MKFNETNFLNSHKVGRPSDMIILGYASQMELNRFPGRFTFERTYQTDCIVITSEICPNVGEFSYICRCRAIYTAAPRQLQASLHCSRLLRIFAAVAPFVRLRLGNCKQACIALGFSVYSPLSRRLYGCASAIASRLALLSASAYICHAVPKTDGILIFCI